MPEKDRERITVLWDDFAEHVYPHDDIELAVRNRYFLTRLQALLKMHRDAVFINLGAGLTSYPYLIEQDIQCIEVDYPHLIEFKKRRVAILKEQKILPEKKLRMEPADLSNPVDLDRLKAVLSECAGERISYVLLEGVSYYLSMSALTALFDMLREIQVSGSVFAFDFWKPDIKQHPVFDRLQRFFVERFDFDACDYNLFDESFINSCAGYRVDAISWAVEQEKIFSNTERLADYNNILPEHYAVLSRT